MSRQYEMSEEDLAEIMRVINTARSTPLIMLQCGMPEGLQEAANRAWAELGSRMGFDSGSVQPIPGMGPRHFTAYPTSSPTGEG